MSKIYKQTTICYSHSCYCKSNFNTGRKAWIFHLVFPDCQELSEMTCMILYTSENSLMSWIQQRWFCCLLAQILEILYHLCCFDPMQVSSALVQNFDTCSNCTEKNPRQRANVRLDACYVYSEAHQRCSQGGCDICNDNLSKYEERCQSFMLGL